jgi:hypothetical protein
MTQEQMRFEAAKAAMQSIVLNSRWDRCHWDVIAEAAVDAADCLLEALAKYPSNEESSVAPDDDGWVHRAPGDPVPSNEFTNVEVMFPDGEILSGTVGYWRGDGRDPKNPVGNWSKCDENPNDAIIAWRPSL